MFEIKTAFKNVAMLPESSTGKLMPEASQSRGYVDQNLHR